MGAGAVEAVLVVTPMETMKTKMIERHLDMIGGVRAILHTGGLRGLYQGLTATVLKQASNQVRAPLTHPPLHLTPSTGTEVHVL